MDKRLISNLEAAELIQQQSLEFAVFKNPGDDYPGYEYIPLAAKIVSPRDNLSAIIMDLKGSSINVNGLYLASLENLIRRISGRTTKSSWAGLDPLIDYPNLLGIHPQKQIEFLTSRYSNFIKQEYLKETYFYSLLWTLISDYDKLEQEKAKNQLIHFGCNDILNDSKFLEYAGKKTFDKHNANAITNHIIHKYGKCISFNTFNDISIAALHIYNQQIHEILTIIKKNDNDSLTDLIRECSNKLLFEPVDGLGEFIALIKGWMDEDIEYTFNSLLEQLKSKSLFSTKHVDIDIAKNKLVTLSRQFKLKPVKIALVTSSSLYETDVLLTDTFNSILTQIDSWAIPSDRKNILKQKFSGYLNIYDCIITSDNIGEMRFKPYRDSYSLALNKLGIQKHKLHEVIAFDDSQNGAISIRASGIGLCVAIPSNKITNHDFSAASFTLTGGLPEALLSYNLFLK